MIEVNGIKLILEHFPDGTLHLKEEIPATVSARITWRYEDNEELLALYFITRHLQERGVERTCLIMPYIPNARQDRVKSSGDVFTLKYFAEIINSLNFSSVVVRDPHSYVSEALFNNLTVLSNSTLVDMTIRNIGDAKLTLFFPDEGAMKRYSSEINMPCTFGMKKRDWETGKILGLDVIGDASLIKDKNILIVDDICSRGGTFYHSAKRLKELGANKIYLSVTHCENTILEGELLTSGLVEKVYTTNSIFTREHERIKVFNV